MSITASEMTPADIAAVTNHNGGGNGWGMNDGSWLIILFLFAILGWGGNGNGCGGGGTGNSGSGFFPYYLANNTDNGVQAGFNNASIAGQLNGIQSGVQNLSTQLCNCCSDMQATVANGFAGAEASANARQIANMQQAFANQTAMTQGFNSLGSQFADCCCENRLATADLKYTIATENCADRYEAQTNTRNIIENANRNNQLILDKLCALELDAKNTKIADLERQLTMANLSASQIAQTAQIERGQVAEVDALYQRLKDCPVPAMPVYGSQPIFTCPNNNNNGCGCGCGNF